MPIRRFEALTDSELLMKVATLAHTTGLDSAVPDQGRLAVLQDILKNMGKEVSVEELIIILKLAQREWLRRQLVDGVQ